MVCADHDVPLSDQLDFGVAMEEMFAEEFHRRRRRFGSRARSRGGGSNPARWRRQPAGIPVLASVATDGHPAVEMESLGEEKLPACMEPWTSLYILRRGVLPCCYGGIPLPIWRVMAPPGTPRSSRRSDQSWRPGPFPCLLPAIAVVPHRPQGQPCRRPAKVAGDLSAGPGVHAEAGPPFLRHSGQDLPTDEVGRHAPVVGGHGSHLRQRTRPTLVGRNDR